MQYMMIISSTALLAVHTYVPTQALLKGNELQSAHTDTLHIHTTIRNRILRDLWCMSVLFLVQVSSPPLQVSNSGKVW